jgi:hypothetical protein
MLDALAQGFLLRVPARRNLRCEKLVRTLLVVEDAEAAEGALRGGQVPLGGRAVTDVIRAQSCWRWVR